MQSKINGLNQYQFLSDHKSLTIKVKIPCSHPTLKPLLEDLVKSVCGHALTTDGDGRVLQAVDGEGRGGDRGQYRVVVPAFIRILRNDGRYTDLGQ